MSNNLVTVATFGTPAQAHVAKGELEAEGIRVMLADEETVGMLWHVAVALGGVKVQVREEDLVRACEIIRHRFGEDEEPLSPEDLEAQALAMAPEDPEDAEPRTIPNGYAEPVGVTEEPEVPENYREECARKLFFVAWLTLIVPPIVPYLFYLALPVLFGSGTLSRRGYLNTVVGFIVLIVALPVGCLGMQLWWQLFFSD